MLTLNEIAAMLKVSKLTARRWYAAGVMPAPMKIAGSLRWRAEDITSWVNDGCPAQVETEQQLAAIGEPK